MTEYKIKVVKQYRLLLSILIVAISLPCCLYLSSKVDESFYKIIIPTFTIGAINTLLYFFSFCKLKILLKDRELTFEWERKLIFNFKKYESILIDDINKIIVEQGVIVKIVTDTTGVEVGGFKTEFIKYNQTGSFELLKLLQKESFIKQFDSWDEWKELGWLNIAYKVNLAILIIGIGIVITFIVVKGFDSKLFYLPLCLGQLIFSHFHLKNKIK